MRIVMFRGLRILAAVVALAVSAAPVAPAGPWQAKVPRPDVGSFSIDIGTSERLSLNAVANRTEGTVRGIYAGHYRDGNLAG